jgi:heme oxygenase
LGDLSGGQIIKRRIAKAYGMDVESGEGIQFYEFKNLEGTKSGTIGDMKKIKEWYRAGMNAGTGDNEKLKGEGYESSYLCNSEYIVLL